MPSAAAQERPARTATTSGFRPDVQGLRAIAVLLVVLYHAGVPMLSGGYVGVDVFFVISGFLITTHLLESLAAHGRISFGSFYAKRARRILPAALLVAGLSTVAAWIWMPPLLMDEVVRGAIATALYVPNILFAVEGTDYLAETSPSVFQHYWSLGIEEQFYLFWPAVLALGFLILRRSERRVFWAAAALTAASFVLCVVWMDVSQPWTFFSLPTRAWELGAGALTAFLMRSGAAWLRRPATGLLSWAGIAALVVTALLFEPTTPFPGYAAALPVLATVALVIGGAAPGTLHANRLLSMHPFQVVGAISYSLYLVHWPLQVIPQVAVGQDDPLSLPVRLALGAVAFPLAWLLFRFVERPVIGWDALRRRSSLLTGAAALAASLSLIATAGAVHLGSAGRQIAAGPAAGPTEQLSQEPQGTGSVPSDLEPSLEAASEDNPAIYDNGCHRSRSSTDSGGCRIGEDEDAPLVFLFGDSHAASWYPALAVLAEQGKIRLDTNTKSSCPSVDVPLVLEGVPYTECDEWRRGVLDRIRAEVPDLVLLANYGAEPPQLVGGDDGFAQRWQEGLETTVDAIGAERVAVLADVPHFEQTPAVCLSAHPEDAAECAAPRTEALSREVVGAEQAATAATGAEHLDLTAYLCNETACPVIIGNLLVYRDAHHLTATFSTRMATPLWREMAPLLG